MVERERSARDDAGKALLAWYEPRRRAYPWRRARPDPYATLVSEVMLQQTQAGRVVPIFLAFLERFPTVRALAGARRADVLRAWAGLGYHRRAVALHRAAQTIVDEHDGRVPGEVAGLRALPGVGPYTASAVASIAFGVRVAAVDTNARRIVARWMHGLEPDELAPARLTEDAGAWMHPARPGDWNQALMDLGRELCRPRPRCEECPIAVGCRFRASGRLGRPSSRAQASFAGSFRQARGEVLATLRARGSVRVADLIAERDDPRTERVLAALVRDGVAEHRSGGRVGLPRG